MDPNKFDYNLIREYETGPTISHILKCFYPSASYDYQQTTPYITRWECDVQAPTDQEIDDCLANVVSCLSMYHLKQLRNKLLSSTDIYMLSDYPITQTEKEAFTTYRQVLRDLPATLVNTTLVTPYTQYLPVYSNLS